MDIHPIESILKQFGLNLEQFERISNLPRFHQLLQQQCETWQGAMNGNERVKAKAAAALEDYLPELHARLHDRKENFLHAVKGAELLAKLAGLGVDKAGIHDSGPGFHLEIHIGDGQTRAVNVAPKLTPGVIEGEAVEVEVEDA